MQGKVVYVDKRLRELQRKDKCNKISKVTDDKGEKKRKIKHEQRRIGGGKGREENLRLTMTRRRKRKRRRTVRFRIKMKQRKSV